MVYDGTVGMHGLIKRYIRSLEVKVYFKRPFEQGYIDCRSVHADDPSVILTNFAITLGNRASAETSFPSIPRIADTPRALPSVSCVAIQDGGNMGVRYHTVRHTAAYDVGKFLSSVRVCIRYIVW